jgi:SprT protein
MTDDSDFQQQTLQETQRLIDLAESHYGIQLPRPDVRFDLTGKTAGMVIFHRRGRPRIRYNHLILSENGEAFIRQTVPHEVAHLVTRTLYGSRIRPHGREWQSTMRLFGAVANRCHNFSTQNVRIKKMRYFPYRCSCRDHQLSTIRHNRSLAGTTYVCRNCGSALKPVESSRQTTASDNRWR